MPIPKAASLHVSLSKSVHSSKRLRNACLCYIPGGVDSVELLSLSKCTFRDAFVSGISMAWVTLVA